MHQLVVDELASSLSNPLQFLSSIHEKKTQHGGSKRRKTLVLCLLTWGGHHVFPSFLSFSISLGVFRIFRQIERQGGRKKLNNRSKVIRLVAILILRTLLQQPTDRNLPIHAEHYESCVAFWWMQKKRRREENGWLLQVISASIPA